MTTSQLHFADRTIPIEHPLTLGRSAHCSLRLDVDGVSRQHAQITPDAAGSVHLEDLGSANGTLLNGSRITGRQRLRDGDRIQLGRAELHFSTDAGDPSASSTAELADVGDKRVDAMRRPESLLGTTLDGHRIDALLGKGRIGATYRARQLRLDRDVALTAFWSGVAHNDPAAARRMMRDIRRAAAVDNAGLTRLHECGLEGDLLWCTAELVDGDSLATLLGRHGRLQLELALLVAERSARALGAIHAAGLVHGDVRPGTIHVTRSGDVKLMDLGIAAMRRRIIGTEAVSRAHHAPELEPDDPPTASADIYALGCTLFELLTGRLPYTATDAAALVAAHRHDPIPLASELRGELTSECDELLHGMLAKRPEWRFSNVDELLVDVHRVREADGAPEARSSTGPVPVPTPGRQRATPVAGTAHSTERDTKLHPGTPRRRRRRQTPWVALAILLGAGVALAMLLPTVLDRIRSMPDHYPPARDDRPAPPSAAERPDPPDAPPPADDGGGASRPPDVPQPAEGDPLRERWTALMQEVDAARIENDWRRAEALLREFQADATATPGSSLAATAASQLRLLRIDAQRWFQRALDDLPPPSDESLRERLIALDEIRRRAAEANRAEADQRYRQAMQRLRRRLARARQEAVQAMERGDMLLLTAIADHYAPAFAGTILEREHAHFATAAAEAARLDTTGDWASTRLALPQATGEQALAAAGTLLLLGDRSAAVRLLLARRELARPPLRERRHALLAATATSIDFTDADDLARMGVRIGDARIADDRLTGPPGEAVSMRIDPALGSAFACELVMDLERAGDEGAGTVTIADAGETTIAFNITDRTDTTAIEAVAGDHRERILTSELDEVLVRVIAVDGRLSAWIDQRQVFDEVDAQPGDGTTLRIDIAGMRWHLRRIRIFGGER